MPRLRTLVSFLVLLAGAAPAAPAAAEADQPFDRARRESIERIRPELEALSRQAGARKLHGERSIADRALVRFDRKHERARKRLDRLPGRNPTGVDDAILAKFVERRRRLAAAHAAALRPHVEHDRHRAVLRADLIALDPDDPVLRRRNGEVFVKGRWTLEETLRTRVRRGKLKSEARKILKSIGTPRTTVVPEPEKRTGVKWSGAVELGDWRVVGTVPIRELRRLAQLFVAAPDLHLAAFGSSPVTPPRRVAVVMRGRKQAAAALATHPDAHQDALEEIPRADSLWLNVDRDRVGLWFPTAVARAELTARQAFDDLFERHFGEALPGWARSGAELYLVHRLVGTRLTFMIEPSRYGTRATEVDDLMRRALQPGADWLAIARGLLRVGRGPDLRVFIGKATNDLSDEEGIWSYAFAAYLIEGRPDDAAKLLRAITTEGERLEDVALRLWTIDLDGLEARFVRWLDETRKLRD